MKNRETLDIVEPNRDLFLQEILDRRRAFCQRFDPITAASGALRDVDYVLASFLARRLKIPAVYADDPALVQFLREQAELEGVVATNLASNGEAVARAATGTPVPDRFTALYLFNPARSPEPAWLDAACSEGSLALLYGIAGETSAALLARMSGMARQGGDRVAFMPRGVAPALWRSTAVLLASTGHRPVLLQALQDFTATFSGDELDALKLAEENLELRASVQRLSLPETNQGEQDRLRGLVAKLETELAAIRRSVLQSEKTIVAVPTKKR